MLKKLFIVPIHNLNTFLNNLPNFNLKLIFLCFIWYFTSVISSSTTKQILIDFKYPVSLTEIQFIINALLCLILLFSIKLFYQLGKINIHQNFPNGTFPPLLINNQYSILNNFLLPSKLILKTTIPMGLFQFLGQIASHNSTSIIPVSLVHTIKALSPLTTVLIYRFFFNKKFQYKTYITLIPLITGVMLSCTRNDNLKISNSLFIKGAIFAFISMLIFVSQNIFAKKILTWDDEKESSPDDNINSDYIYNKIRKNSFTNDDDDDDESRAKAFLSRFNWKITKPESAISTPLLPVSIDSYQTRETIRPTYFNFQNNNSSNSNININEFEYQMSSPLNSSQNSVNNSSTELNKKYLPHESTNNKKLDKLSVLFYCSIVGFVLTLPFYIISEIGNYSSLTNLSISNLNSRICKLIIYYGISHFIQSLTAFQILGMVSPVNYSIANILKRIIIISCSIIIEGINLNFQQYFGLSLTFIGLYCYDKWGVQR